MYSEFAYSTQMQILLALVTYIVTFLSTYMISNLILVTFNVVASVRQKLLFCFITGTILQNTFVYAVFLLGGRMSFGQLTYFLVVNPNPIVAMLYYFTAQRVFHLPPARSVKLMSYVYIFWITSNAINRFTGSLFFVQRGARYNYLLDASQQAVALVVFFLICTSVQSFLKRSHASLSFSENMFFNKKRELLFHFLKAVFVYTVSVLFPLRIEDQAIAHVIVTLVLLLFILVNICLDIIRYNRQIISNRDVHINTLFKSMEVLQGIKHDFNNILHTYSGYLELGEYKRLEKYHASLVAATSHAGSIMELTQKMPENPAMIELLIRKMEYAERMNVRLTASLKCELNNLYIDDLDLSQSMACILDYAIESARDSHQRKILVTVESKARGSKIIIITCSTAAPIGEAAEAISPLDAEKNEMRLGIVRSILGKYGNCSFQMKHHNYEFSSYIELRKAA